MNPVIFTIFGIDIQWYSILILIGIVIGLILLEKEAKKFKYPKDLIFNICFWAIIMGIIGARLYYIIFNFSYYSNNLLEIFAIWNGGLAIHGGIIAGVLTVLFFAKKYHLNFLKLLDMAAPSLILAQAIGRWGNFFNIEAYGTQTNLPWRMGIVENGIYKEVHPAFLYESIATFCIFIFLMIKNKKRKFSGETTYLYLILYSIARFLIEGLRTDSLMFLNLRISQIVSVMLFAVSCFMLSKNRIKQKRKNQNEVK